MSESEVYVQSSHILLGKVVIQPNLEDHTNHKCFETHEPGEALGFAKSINKNVYDCWAIGHVPLFDITIVKKGVSIVMEVPPVIIHFTGIFREISHRVILSKRYYNIL